MSINIDKYTVLCECDRIIAEKKISDPENVTDEAIRYVKQKFNENIDKITSGVRTSVEYGINEGWCNNNYYEINDRIKREVETRVENYLMEYRRTIYPLYDLICMNIEQSFENAILGAIEDSTKGRK